MANLLNRLWLTKICKDQRGQDMTEYALISGLLASVTLAIVPEMISVSLHIIVVLQDAAQAAMHAAGIEY